MAVLIIVIAIRARRGFPQNWLPRKWSFEFFLTPILLLLIFSAGIALPFLFSAKAYDNSALKLDFPLEDGTFITMAGGANWSVNQHSYLSGPSQRYAIDISSLNVFGMRANSLAPSQLDEFEVYGAKVVSPCNGEIVEVESNLPNQTPYSPRSDHQLGNHIIIYCLDSSVVLGHLEPQSITVQVGATVQRGQLLAFVGNSGSTLEPHLHIHAVQGRHGPENDIIHSKSGIPILLGDRFLVKHEWFKN